MSVAPTHSAGRAFAELAWWSGVALVGLLAVLAAAVACGRLAGAAMGPLSASTLLVVALLAAGASVAARRLCAAGRAGPSGGRGAAEPLQRDWVRWAPLPSLAVMALALSVPGTAVLGLLALWGVLVLEEGASLGLEGVQALRRRNRAVSRPRLHRTDPPQTPTSHLVLAAPVAEAEKVEAQCVQRLVRSSLSEGTEQVAGWLRVDLAPGQRTASAHAAFCPALGQTPVVEVRQSSGPAARIKTAQCLPYGVRFDLKLAQPVDAPSAVVLEFSATAGPAPG